MGSVGNPALSAAAERAPVTVTGSQCSFDPFAQNQATACGRTLGELTKLGVSYTVVQTDSGFDSVQIRIGNREVASEDPELLRPALEAKGYALDRKSGVEGKSVEVRLGLGGRRVFQKKKKKK